MATLYRKYRPQTFSDLIGQEHLTQTIVNEIASGRLAHAYLFSGPRGIGKTTLARLIAKAVNCQNQKNGKFEPCNECSSCQEITDGRNIDVIEIDAASNTGVDNVRENIIDSAQFHPSRSKYKIFIIDEVHMLSTSAFNALLKTLEEPPAYVIFILATTEWHKIPATIVSRCQRFNFQKISPELITQKLQRIAEQEEIEVSPTVIKRIIGKSDGCLRDAESLLGQILSLNLKTITEKDIQTILPTTDIEQIILFLDALAKKQVNRALELIEEMASAGVNLEQFALDFIETLRAIMIMQIGQKNLRFSDFSDSAKKKLKEISDKFSTEEIIRLMETAIQRRQEMKHSPIPQLPLELMAIELAGQYISTTLNDGQSVIKDKKNSVQDRSASGGNSEASVTEKNDCNAQSPLKSAIVNAPPAAVTIGEIKKCWPEVINQLSEEYHSLIFVLKMAELKGLNGRQLTITLPYSFHKEKIEEKKSKKAIEDCLREILHEKITLLCEVAPQTQKQNSKKQCDMELSELAAQFGGEVIA